MRTLVLSIAVLSSLGLARISQAEWAPKAAPVMTRWAKDVAPDRVHQEYPRPQLARPHWLNLNGLWDYAITPLKAERPQEWAGQILVPFPCESALSGVMQPVGPERALWYRRSFKTPADAAWQGQRVLLHFGAVDWECTVWVNGTEVGQHRGGYDPFSFDISAALRPEQNELVVRVVDPSDAGYQPRGKQMQQPHGIWYTPTTGIWQTVWLEPVPKTYIRQVHLVPDLDTGMLTVSVDVAHPAPGQKFRITFGSEFHRLVAPEPSPVATPDPVSLGVIPATERWTPSNPKLQDCTVSLIDAAGTGDSVSTYFAWRKISVGKDAEGITRLLLNNEPLFQYGTLDQGFWPDGLYTAPSDAALKWDIEITKQYGFNMIRKHVKVEPARWYYHCDRLGMLVWQDMPSGDQHANWDPFGKFNGQEITRNAASASNFRQEWQHIMDALRAFPSIVVWVPFNEAWGQFDTVAVSRWTKEYDPTRLVNCASGGNDFPVGDIVDVHRYPGPFAPRPEEKRAAVLGEYGGLGLPLKGHTWQGEKNWGYRSFTTAADLTEAYLDLVDRLQPLIREPGLSAAIYTQTTDVEIEVNGLLTYDREVQKIPVDVAAKAHQQLWQPSLRTHILVPSAQRETVEWRYTLEQPSEGWEQSAFDDQTWKTGPGGFGEASTPGSVVRTPWKTDDIWLRREFTLDTLPTGELRLWLHHDEDAEVSLNGVPLKRVKGYTTDYQSYRVTAEGRAALKTGRNVLAIHCHQTGGGQYIDAGLDVRTPAEQ